MIRDDKLSMILLELKIMSSTRKDFMQNKKFTLRIPEPTASKIAEFADKMNKTPSDVIRQALREFFWNLDHKKDEHKDE